MARSRFCEKIEGNGGGAPAAHFGQRRSGGGGAFLGSLNPMP